MANICADAGFFIGLHDPQDPYFTAANALFRAYLETSPHRLLVPWPILYESLNTRMARRQDSVREFRTRCDDLERQRRLLKLDDVPYREMALLEGFEESRKAAGYRPLSLTDRVVRHMLYDEAIRIDYFVTFNVGDFADVCRKRGIRMIQRPSDF